MPITRNLNFQTDDTQKPFDDVESTNSVTKQQRSESVESRSVIPSGEASKGGETGYSHTGAFADKPTSNNYVWEAGTGIAYTQADVDAGTYKVMSLSRSVHDAVDNPYWSTPTPSGTTGIGLFQGANLPDGVTSLLDYDFNYDASYPSSSGTGFEGSTGRIKLK